MTTFRQLQAITEVVDRKSFDAAAAALGIAQSAVSRHVQELESQFGYSLLDRTKRSAELTAKGEEIVMRARRILSVRDQIDAVMEGKVTRPRTLRVAVDELTALTWLSKWLRAIRQAFPLVDPVVMCGEERNLRALLAKSEVDIIVVSSAEGLAGYARLQLEQVSFGWYCTPDFVPPISQQGQVDRRRRALHAACPGLAASLSLALSGTGLAFLPKPFCKPWVVQGSLYEVMQPEAGPSKNYSVVFAGAKGMNFFREVAELGRASCDFERSILMPPS